MMTAEQTPLFDDGAIPAIGYTGPQACRYAGVTYRQLDYWTRTDLITPEHQSATGSGSRRLYSFRDIVLLRVIKSLLNAGMSLTKIRATVAQLRAFGVRDLSAITLVSDGESVYEVVDETQLLDLLRGGQGMFTLGLSSITRDVSRVVAIPERIEVDELAERRLLRQAC